MKYELPNAVKEEYLRLWNETQRLKDGIARMRKAGLDTTSLELKLQDAEEKLNNVMTAFDITPNESK
jgi:hypothetical protein